MAKYLVRFGDDSGHGGEEIAIDSADAVNVALADGNANSLDSGGLQRMEREILAACSRLDAGGDEETISYDASARIYISRA